MAHGALESCLRAAWRKGRALAPLALATFLAACEPEPTGGVFPDLDSQVGGGSDGKADGAGGGGDGGAGSSTLSGTWAQITEWSTCVKVADEIETRAWRLLRVELKQEGGKLHEKRTLCELRLTPIFGLMTVVPQPLIDAHPLMTVESVLVGQGEGAPYLGGPEIQQFGIAFKDIYGDPMPAKADVDDPRLVDSENDGKPGATFHVGPSCSIHIAQRESATLHGSVQADGSFRGGGVHLTEQTVFSSTKAICGSQFSTRANDGANSFVMVRAEAFDADKNGEVSCAELRAVGESIAKPMAADDKRCLAKP